MEFYKLPWHENPQEQEMKREIKARTVMESWLFSKIYDPDIGPMS